MQVTNTLSEGLKREFSVILPAPELEARLSSELTVMKDKVRINGFRPGKVPMQHLRRVYGRSVMADVVQKMVNETNQKIIADHSIKLALEPKIVFPENEAEVEAALSGKSGLEYKVSLEILPNFEVKSFSDLKVSRLVANVDDTSVDETLERLASQNKVFTARKEGAKSKNGDRITIDFVGMIDDVPFEGGAGTDVPVEIGSNSFIPGFEEQLIGVVQGETLIVKATFPENYSAQHLAGKEASFNVTVKGVEAPGETKINDEFATSLGMESLGSGRQRRVRWTPWLQPRIKTMVLPSSLSHILRALTGMKCFTSSKRSSPCTGLHLCSKLPMSQQMRPRFLRSHSD